MLRHEGLELLQPLCAFPERRLSLGKLEVLIVLALAEQRERAGASGGQVPLCLRLDELAAHLGLPVEPPEEYQQTMWRLKQAISRANASLAAQELTIVSLRSNLGLLGYSLFQLSEIWAYS